MPAPTIALIIDDPAVREFAVRALVDLVGIFGLGALLFIRRVRLKLLQLFKREMRNLTWMSGSSTELSRKVHDILVGLRTRLGACRASVYQFHNGGTFMLSQPTWRVSCTHEAVAPGITYESSKFSNVLVSTLTDLLEPVCVDNPAERPGVTRLSRCLGECPNRDPSRHPTWFDVDAMAPSSSRHALAEQGIRHMVVYNMFSNDRQTFGFVALHFTHELSENLRAEIAADLCHMCRQVTEMKYLLLEEGRKES